jgi:hypothetical protein
MNRIARLCDYLLIRYASEKIPDLDSVANDNVSTCYKKALAGTDHPHNSRPSWGWLPLISD